MRFVRPLGAVFRQLELKNLKTNFVNHKTGVAFFKQTNRNMCFVFVFVLPLGQGSNRNKNKKNPTRLYHQNRLPTYPDKTVKFVLEGFYFVSIGYPL